MFPARSGAGTHPAGLAGTYEKLSMGWPTCEMCASSRYRKGCSVGKVPAPGGSDSQVPSIQDSGSTTGLILGGSEDREGREWLLPAVPGSLAWTAHHVPGRPRSSQTDLQGLTSPAANMSLNLLSRQGEQGRAAGRPRPAGPALEPAVPGTQWTAWRWGEARGPGPQRRLKRKHHQPLGWSGCSCTAARRCR